MRAEAHELYLKVRRLLEHLEAELERVSIVVVILGAGPCERAKLDKSACDECPSDERRRCRFFRRLRLKNMLNQMGVIAILPDELRMRYPHLEEEAVLAMPEINMIFIFPESPGSITEFTQLIGQPAVANKMRVLIFRRYHPLLRKSERGYLSHLLSHFMALYGHVYPYEDEHIEGRETEVLPSPDEVVRYITDYYRAAKYHAVRES